MGLGRSMGKNPGDPYVIPIVVTLLVASVPLGMFPWAVLITVGLGAIQAGLHGFRSSGYGLIGRSRLNGKLARILGGIMIAIGVVWEMVLIWFLICGFSRLP